MPPWFSCGWANVIFEMFALGRVGITSCTLIDHRPATVLLSEVPSHMRLSAVARAALKKSKVFGVKEAAADTEPGHGSLPSRSLSA